MIDTKQIQAMAELRRALQIFATTLYADDEAAMQIASIYPVWAADKQYKANAVISYRTNSVGDPQLYLVLQAHKSQSDWLPDATASLYKKMGIGESGYPIWTQPLGAVDAYNIGDIVSYNGKLYKSIINANVWSPDVYPAGWEEYTESTGGGDTGEPGGGGTTEPATPPAETNPEFVQPTGAQDAYSPSAYPAGWKEVTE